MATIIDDLRARARILQRQARAGDPAALARLERARVLRRGEAVTRAQCLSALARELGFAGWSHVTRLLDPEPAAELRATPDDAADFGTALHPWSASGHLNIWSASYDEARAIRAEHGGFLLAYKRQFMIVDRFFIEALGLDPEDPDWERIGRNWVAPSDLGARARLYTKLLRARLEERALG